MKLKRGFMLTFFENAPWYVGTLVLAFIIIFISLMGLFIVRSRISPHKLKANHDVAGFTFGIIGVMYAVLLSFIVVSVQERYNETQNNLDSEANIVTDLFRDSQVFPEEVRNKIHQHLREYAKVMINFKWLEPDIKPSPEEIVNELWNVYYSYTPQNDADKVWFSESIQKLNDFNRLRLLRHFATKESVGPMMWTLLFIGAAITICFMYFFSVENVFLHSLMIAMLAGFIAFMLFFIYSLDTAFTGDIHVSSAHFNEVLRLFDVWETGTH